MHSCMHYENFSVNFDILKKLRRKKTNTPLPKNLTQGTMLETAFINQQLIHEIFVTCIYHRSEKCGTVPKTLFLRMYIKLETP